MASSAQGVLPDASDSPTLAATAAAAATAASHIAVTDAMVAAFLAMTADGQVERRAQATELFPTQTEDETADAAMAQDQESVEDEQVQEQEQEQEQELQPQQIDQVAEPVDEATTNASTSASTSIGISISTRTASEDPVPIMSGSAASGRNFTDNL